MLDQLATFAAALPNMDGMYWLMLASRIAHVLSAVILVGGLFYLRTVVTPALADGSGASDSADRLFGGSRAKWAMWVGIASLLLLVTGLFNFLQIVKLHEKLGPVYHAMAGTKILAGLALFVLAAILSGSSAAAVRFRGNWRTWLNVCLVLGILLVVIGSFMRSFDHIRKMNAPIAPTEVAK